MCWLRAPFWPASGRPRRPATCGILSSSSSKGTLSLVLAPSARRRAEDRSCRDQVALGAEPASVGRVRPGLVTPILAARDALSTQARLQSIRLAARNRRSNSPPSPSQTPASCQSRRRRQQVMPDLHPISSGSISHLNAGPQHEQDPGQCRANRDPRSPTSWSRRHHGQQRFNDRPQSVREQRRTMTRGSPSWPGPCPETGYVGVD